MLFDQTQVPPEAARPDVTVRAHEVLNGLVASTDAESRERSTIRIDKRARVFAPGEVMDPEKTGVRPHDRGDPISIPRLDVAAEDQVVSRS
jgi:hypothetical protein